MKIKIKTSSVITIAIMSVLLTGLFVMLYPVFSDYFNSLTQSRVIAKFDLELLELDDGDYLELLNAAREYNENLHKKRDRFVLSQEDEQEYMALLDFTGTGVIGSLKIDAIKVNLPIYLGTGASTLQKGAGHFEGSSLPIGGQGTHSVISGHSGLPSSTLLTNLDKLVIGDTFTIKVLKDTLTYEVDKITVTDPEDMSLLEIDKNEDYCTLLTCTPYGVNSHRILVRGYRIFPDEEDQTLQPNCRDIDGAVWIICFLIAAAVCKIIVTLICKNTKIKKG